MELITKLRNNGREEATKFQYLAFSELEELKQKNKAKKHMLYRIIEWFKSRNAK